MDLKLFTEDWNEFIRLAKSHRIRFLLVGGVALALHGLARSTQDLDIWIDNTKPNVARLKKVLAAYGFVEMANHLPDKLEPREAIFLGKVPYRLDILSGVSGITFGTAYRTRQMIKQSGMMMPVASLEQLLINKTVAGRPKDLGDIESIKQKIKANRRLRSKPGSNS